MGVSNGSPGCDSSKPILARARGLYSDTTQSGLALSGPEESANQMPLYSFYIDIQRRMPVMDKSANSPSKFGPEFGLSTFIQNGPDKGTHVEWGRHLNLSR